MIRVHGYLILIYIKLLIFDLDGTLIDSRLDLVHSVNASLRQLGRPELAGRFDCQLCRAMARPC